VSSFISRISPAHDKYRDRVRDPLKNGDRRFSLKKSSHSWPETVNLAVTFITTMPEEG